MNDIRNKTDIEVLVSRFYDKLLADDKLKHIFQHLDLAEHLPRIVHFWSFVLLDEEGYRTNVFDKHLKLPIQPENFEQWLRHFTETVDELYAGELADMAKQRATVLAFTFRNKWETLGKHKN